MVTAEATATGDDHVRQVQPISPLQGSMCSPLYMGADDPATPT